jgi:F-type H+-transporting ATPase subunit delta
MTGVAGRYASALFELATEQKSVDATGAALTQLKGLIGASADLERLIRNPVFTADEQTRAIGAVLAKAKIAGLAGNFVRLVASNRRLFALPQMISAYHQMVANAKGIVTAEVTLASPPSAKVVKDIETALKDVAGSSVSVDVKVDPAIIGGIVVKIGSKMVDASLKTKLNSMRLAMKEVG